jgi:hypothetical protein
LLPLVFSLTPQSTNANAASAGPTLEIPPHLLFFISPLSGVSSEYRDSVIAGKSSDILPKSREVWTLNIYVIALPRIFSLTRRISLYHCSCALAAKAFNMAIFRKMSLKVSDKERTKAAELTLKQSIYPLMLVTVLFFLWGFSYGLLDTLNKHFQNTLGITRARSSGLQAAYFGYVCVSRPDLIPEKRSAYLKYTAPTRLHLSVMQIGSYDIMVTSLFSSGVCASMELGLSSLGHVFFTDPLEASVPPSSLSEMV